MSTSLRAGEIRVTRRGPRPADRPRLDSGRRQVHRSPGKWTPRQLPLPGGGLSGPHRGRRPRRPSVPGAFLRARAWVRCVRPLPKTPAGPPRTRVGSPVKRWRSCHDCSIDYAHHSRPRLDEPRGIRRPSLESLTRGPCVRAGRPRPRPRRTGPGSGQTRPQTRRRRPTPPRPP